MRINIGNWISPVVMTILALGCLVLGVRSFFQEQAFLARAELDTGTITTYELNVRNDGKSEYCPRIEFTSKAGEPVAFRDTSDCPNAPDQSKIGQQVQVYYDPANPDSIETKTGSTGYDGLIFGVIGFLFFGLIGLINVLAIYLTGRRRAARASADQAYGTQNLLRQDAQRYHANQARDNARGAADAGASADEARLAQLKQQEAELKRKIEERRRSDPKGFKNP